MCGKVENFVDIVGYSMGGVEVYWAVVKVMSVVEMCVALK